MSYGFYRLGANADPAKAKRKFGALMSGQQTVIMTPANPVKIEEPPHVKDTLPGSPKSMGFTGNTCDHCGSTRMIRAGHCEACSDCGTTTGCS